MLDHRIKQFIESLLEIKTTLNIDDLGFLTLLVSKHQNLFSDSPSNLGEADFFWLEKLFALRWEKVFRKFHDYTYGTDGVNAHWIIFAKDLAAVLQKPFLLILMPTLTNRLDPNNFSRLSAAFDPRCIYISGNVWHRVSALYDQFQKKGVFGVLDNPKNLRQRSLTIHEFDSLRRKRGADLAIINDKFGEPYANIFDYLKRKVAPTWKINGLNTSYLFPETLKLVEDYFDGKDRGNDFRVFHASCKIFFDNLVKNPLIEVNHFYGARIKVKDGSRYFLFEILVDCLQENKEGLTDKLLGVAKWIAKTDPSLISKNKHLKPVYARQKIGEYFDLKAIRKSVVSLNIADTDSYKLLQIQILEILDNVLTNPAVNVKRARVPIIGLITKLFHMRGWEVIDTKFDYTRYLQNKANFPWLKFALKLAGAEDINYYHALLIPSLTQKNYDVITRGPFSEHALSKCILSSTGKELIFLPHSKSYYKANGLFYKNVHLNPEPLSREEIKRLAFADPAIYRLFCHSNAKSQEDTKGIRTISKITINELRKVVNGSLNPKGLEEEIEDDDENTPAQAAYNNFAPYLNSLPTEEKNNFLQYKVLFSNRRITIRQIFGWVQAYDPEWQGCATLFALFLAQVIMDHAPLTKFINAIERNVKISVSLSIMRATSAKRVYSDYDHLTDTEAVKRILTLTTSLMTHSFDIWLLGTKSKLVLGNYENTVNFSGKEIFELVRRNIDRGDFKHARFLYVQLIEHLVPSYLEVSWTANTKVWLNSIQNESLFSPGNQTCFDPESLLTALWQISQKNQKIKTSCENFLHKLYKILSSSDNRYKKWVLANIGFTKFLMDPVVFDYKAEIIASLRLAKDKFFSPEQNSQISEDFLSGKESCFDPKLILTVLWPLAQKNSSIKLACDNFLDNLHVIQASHDRRSTKWIRVNVEFSKLLTDPSMCNYNSTLLVELNLMKDNPPSPKQVLQASKDFLIHRLAQFGSQNVSPGQAGIFGCAPGQNRANYAEVKKLLNEKLEAALARENNACLSINDLLITLNQIASRIDKSDFSNLQLYLKQFDPEKFTTSTEELQFDKKIAIGW